MIRRMSYAQFRMDSGAHAGAAGAIHRAGTITKPKKATAAAQKTVIHSGDRRFFILFFKSGPIHNSALFVKALDLVRINLAGIPAAILRGGISSLTTAPAPITLSDPI